jgi:hypothetical protein
MVKTRIGELIGKVWGRNVPRMYLRIPTLMIAHVGQVVAGKQQSEMDGESVSDSG